MPACKSYCIRPCSVITLQHQLSRVSSMLMRATKWSVKPSHYLWSKNLRFMNLIISSKPSIQVYLCSMAISNKMLLNSLISCWIRWMKRWIELIRNLKVINHCPNQTQLWWSRQSRRLPRAKTVRRRVKLAEQVLNFPKLKRRASCSSQ